MLVDDFQFWQADITLTLIDAWIFNPAITAQIRALELQVERVRRSVDAARNTVSRWGRIYDERLKRLDVLDDVRPRQPAVESLVLVRL